MTPKTNILLIEDDKSICNFISASLESSNYRVTCAQTGKEGLSLATSLCPDVYLLDLGLPDIDGLDVLAKLRTWTSNPVIVISARTKEQEKVTALDTTNWFFRYVTYKNQNPDFYPYVPKST